jgi:hypothetical protein
MNEFINIEEEYFPSMEETLEEYHTDNEDEQVYLNRAFSVDKTSIKKGYAHIKKSKWYDQDALILADPPSPSRSRELLMIRDAYGADTTLPSFDKTGYFYTRKINNKWFYISPSGYPMYIPTICSSRLDVGNWNQDEFKRKFNGDKAKLAQYVTNVCKNNGLHHGAWSDYDQLRRTKDARSHVILLSFLASFASSKGYNKMGNGNHTYTYQGIKDVMPILHPEFPSWCAKVAEQKVRPLKDRKDIIGFYFDNELPLVKNEPSLPRYLSLPKGDIIGDTVREWLNQRRKEGKNASEDNREFLKWHISQYANAVTCAIKKVDTDHLLFGPRLHGGALKEFMVYQALAPFVNVLSFNHYGRFRLYPEIVEYAKRVDRPVEISEWYAKAEENKDALLKNKSGAGMLVAKQKDRAVYYQSMVIDMVQSGQVIGWSWLALMDNSPRKSGVDPSNIDANKGILGANDFSVYEELVDTMAQTHASLYRI